MLRVGQGGRQTNSGTHYEHETLRAGVYESNLWSLEDSHGATRTPGIGVANLLEFTHGAERRNDQ